MEKEAEEEDMSEEEEWKDRDEKTWAWAVIKVSGTRIRDVEKARVRG